MGPKVLKYVVKAEVKPDAAEAATVFWKKEYVPGTGNVVVNGPGLEEI